MNVDKNLKSVLSIQELARKQLQAREAQKAEQQKQEEVAVTARLLNQRLGLEAAESQKAAEKLVRGAHAPEEKVQVNGKEVSVEDISFIIAQSLQLLYSETDPMQEYHEWITDCGVVMQHLTDGEVTEQDLDEKFGFLNFLEQREAELKAVMSIYRSSTFEGAKKQLAFLEYKWQRLMELKEVLKNNTANDVTKAAERTPEKKAEDRQRGIEIYVALKSLELQERMRWQKGDYDFMHDGRFRHQVYGHSCVIVPDRDLIRYGFVSKDLFDDYGLLIKRNRTADYQQSISEIIVTAKQPAQESKAALIHRLEILTGRRQPEQKLQIKGPHAFNPEVYRRLEAKNLSYVRE